MLALLVVPALLGRLLGRLQQGLLHQSRLHDVLRVHVLVSHLNEWSPDSTCLGGKTHLAEPKVDFGLVLLLQLFPLLLNGLSDVFVGLNLHQGMNFLRDLLAFNLLIDRGLILVLNQ